MPTYSPHRAQNIEPIARAALRCDLFSQVIISNHNPHLRLADWVRLRDDRLRLIDQPVRRGSGYRWVVAREAQTGYYLSQDDDSFVSPEQLQRLCEHLVSRPDAPHGLAGRRGSRYCINVETQADVLYHLFAVTRAQLDTYFDRLGQMAAVDPSVPEAVETCCDDIVMSNTGAANAYVHAVGPLTMCPTENRTGVALHTEADFWRRRYMVWNIMKRLRYCAEDTPIDQ